MDDFMLDTQERPSYGDDIPRWMLPEHHPDATKVPVVKVRASNITPAKCRAMYAAAVTLSRDTLARHAQRLKKHPTAARWFGDYPEAPESGNTSRAPWPDPKGFWYRLHREDHGWYESTTIGQPRCIVP